MPTKFFKRILTIELLIFHQHFVTPKECSCPLLWWKTNYHMWLNVAWLARHILVILGSQLKTKQFFYVISVFTSLQKCRFGVENLNSLVMIYKNWPNDVKVGCSLANDDVTKFFATKANLLKLNEIELSEVQMFKEE